jgi:hypothetical protein
VILLPLSSEYPNPVLAGKIKFNAFRLYFQAWQAALKPFLFSPGFTVGFLGEYS